MKFPPARKLITAPSLEAVIPRALSGRFSAYAEHWTPKVPRMVSTEFRVESVALRLPASGWLPRSLFIPVVSLSKACPGLAEGDLAHETWETTANPKVF